MAAATRPLTLHDWFLREGLTFRALGVLIGCPARMAFAYCQDPDVAEFRMPRPDRMRRIFTVTNGEVGPASFYKLPRITRPFDPAAPELPLDQAA